jgi:hypothetical protein
MVADAENKTKEKMKRKGNGVNVPAEDTTDSEGDLEILESECEVPEVEMLDCIVVQLKQFIFCSLAMPCIWVSVRHRGLYILALASFPFIPGCLCCPAHFLNVLSLESGTSQQSHFSTPTSFRGLLRVHYPAHLSLIPVLHLKA